MSESSAKTYRPGEIVPQSGIYECDCEQRHEYSTDVKEYRLPPLHDRCGGGGWKLKAAPHPNP
ncbi:MULTISPECIES: hypothetical protein [unclassified Streptomyces]|uniref:hypothetical protein n=1 Tax=unclassified Streptomyces TaxID=2593676 RepID=UPI00099C46CE|nr:MULTISPECIES: hypothetical protein [unclassified Streptomyces]